MIARIWHGYTTNTNAEGYAPLLKAEILPGIVKVPGYQGSYLLRRPCGEEIEFVTVMLWDSLESLREFAGPDYEQAIVPAERRRFLSHYEKRSAHYEILMRSLRACSPACSAIANASSPATNSDNACGVTPRSWTLTVA